jgi:hypothetical protein
MAKQPGKCLLKSSQLNKAAQWQDIQREKEINMMKIILTQQLKMPM